MENLLSVEECAKRLGGLSKHTINAWLSQGKLQRTKVGGRTMIRESELQKVINDGGKSLLRSVMRSESARFLKLGLTPVNDVFDVPAPGRCG